MIYFQSRLPNNFYLLFVKIGIFVLLFLFSTDLEFYFSIPLGVITGIVAHVITSYYDCYVTVNNTKIKLVYIRPFFMVEEYDLDKMDEIKIINENKSETSRDLWYLTSEFNLLPYQFETLILTKNNSAFEVRFRTPALARVSRVRTIL